MTDFIINGRFTLEISRRVATKSLEKSISTLSRHNAIHMQDQGGRDVQFDARQSLYRDRTEIRHSYFRPAENNRAARSKGIALTHVYAEKILL